MSDLLSPLTSAVTTDIGWRLVEYVVWLANIILYWAIHKKTKITSEYVYIYEKFVLIQGDNSVISNRRYDEFYTKW